jgi:glutamate--glyoxylate aminotransferase
MVPIPQYPLYSASIALYGGSLVPYSLNEKDNWSMDISNMKKVVAAARAEGKNVRALVFINPGNPTGQCLSKKNLTELVQFAYDEKIVLLCDEVYQENIYQDERPFVSARKVAYEIGEPVRSGLEMLCFHTVSKGSLGECGLRGGYVEMVNIHEGTVNEIYKVASINLSPNVPGQVAMSLMVNPPKPGMPSYEQFRAEKDEILSTLRERAHIMTDGFNSLEGVTCNFTEGAMYSFPQIRIPPKAIEAAKAAGKAPDVFYCLRLLEATGISTVPGSGFGQEPGTFHLRTTILPPVEKMKEVVKRYQDFHSKFMDEFR